MDTNLHLVDILNFGASANAKANSEMFQGHFYFRRFEKGTIESMTKS